MYLHNVLNNLKKKKNWFLFLKVGMSLDTLMYGPQTVYTNLSVQYLNGIRGTKNSKNKN